VRTAWRRAAAEDRLAWRSLVTTAALQWRRHAAADDEL